MTTDEIKALLALHDKQVQELACYEMTDLHHCAPDLAAEVIRLGEVESRFASVLDLVHEELCSEETYNPRIEHIVRSELDRIEESSTRAAVEGKQ